MARTYLSPPAIRRLLEPIGNGQEVNQALLTAFEHGRIPAQAASVITTDKTVTPERVTTATPKGIDASLRARLAGSPSHLEEVWATGSCDLDTATARIAILDVGFDEAGVKEVISRWATERSKKTFATTGRPTAEWWSDFTVELVDLFYSTPQVTEQKPERLVADVLTRLAKAGHDKVTDRSVRETVHKALSRVREN